MPVEVTVMWPLASRLTAIVSAVPSPVTVRVPLENVAVGVAMAEPAVTASTPIALRATAAARFLLRETT
jgi:hypothetical protein